MKRRAFLGTLTVPIIAGCTSGNSGQSTSTSSPTATPSPTSTPTETSTPTATRTPTPNRPLIDSFNNQRTIKEDHWYGRELSFDRDGVLEYRVTVRDGPPVDVFLMARGEYQAYSNSKSFEWVETASKLNTEDAQVRAQITNGNYVWLIDNTDEAGKANPPTETSKVTVEYEVRLLGPPSG